MLWYHAEGYLAGGSRAPGNLEMPAEKCVRQSAGRQRDFSALPRDVFSLIAAKLCPRSRGVARLVCKDLDSAVIGNLDDMDVRLFLRHVSSGRLGPRVSVRRGNVTAKMARGRGSLSGPALTGTPLTGTSLSGTPLTGTPLTGPACRMRAEALVELFGVTVIQHEADEDSPLFDLGTWVHVTPDRWRMVGLEIVDPRGGQVAAPCRDLFAEVESLSVRATSSRSSRRGQALAASVLSGGNPRRLRLSLPGWPGSAVFSSLHRCPALASLEIISTGRADSEVICRNVSAIASCGALEKLRLRWFGRGDDAFRSICAAFSAGSSRPALRDLDIDCDLRDGSSLERIADCFPALERISARRIECSSAGIEALSRLTGLVRLELCWSMAAASPPRAISCDVGRDGFPALREACVCGCGATEGELGWLSGARRLEILDASDNTLRRIPALHPEARLDRLDLSWNYLGYSSAELLSGPVFSRLRFLDVSNNELLDYGAVAVARSVGPGRGLPAVDTLLIHHNRLSSSGTRFLEGEMLARLGPAGVNEGLLSRVVWPAGERPKAFAQGQDQ